MSVLVASYNIHRCYGRDGRHDPERIKKILQNIDADVIALQEVELLHEAPGLLDYLCHNTSWSAVRGLTLTRESGHYGNTLLTRLPIQTVERINLSMPGHEPRGALYVQLKYQDQSLAILTTHLGLRSYERVAQVNRILDKLSATDEADLTVLMGDLNEWLPWGRSLYWLRSYFHRHPAPASFPSSFPVLALDRIFVRPYNRLISIMVHKNPLTRLASDHLPLTALLE